MARTNIPLNVLQSNSYLALPSTTAVDATNGMICTTTDGRLQYVVFDIKNTAGTTQTLTVDAGAAYPSGAPFRAAEGPLSVSFASGAEAFVGPFESAIFSQADGLSIWLDFSAGFTGTVIAYYVPSRQT